MPFRNTDHSYGHVTKTIHWLMLFMILTVIPVGLMAVDLAHDIRDPKVVSTTEDFARAFWLFSAHKTLGMGIFIVALVRIIWALSQPKPGLLKTDKPVEAFAAHLVHWLLYGSLLLVPLTGWLTHAATTGFAPIHWPFGQSLPFVPKDEGLATTLAGAHMVLERVMVLSILLHVAGALKHHLIDGDLTLRRMLPGKSNAPLPPAQSQSSTSMMVAIGIWIIALGAGVGIGVIAPWERQADAERVPAVQPDIASQWQVSDGDLAISVTQLGNRINGRFAEWSANIEFEDATGPGVLGKVEVVVDIASLTLGSVSDQAMGPDFFDADFFPEATFTGEISKAETGYIATGPLTIRDTTKVVSLAFDLILTENSAQMQGALNLKRLEFGVGANMADESSLGWTVDVTISLTATRQ